MFLLSDCGVGVQAGSEDFIERRMADRFELDVQTLQEDAPPDTNPSLVELAAQLVQVHYSNIRGDFYTPRKILPFTP